jgi:hypothetical protein
MDIQEILKNKKMGENFVKIFKLTHPNEKDDSKLTIRDVITTHEIKNSL